MVVMTVMAPPPPGTVCCLLCRGMVAYRGGDVSRFNNHMHYEHGAYFDHEFLLAACLMNEEERKAVRDVMSAKKSSNQSPTSDPSPTLSPQTPGPILESRENDPVKTPQSKRKRTVDVNDVTEKTVGVKTETMSQVIEASVSGEKKVTFECEECHRSYTTRKSLSCHLTKTGHGAKSKTPTPSSAFPSPSRSETPPQSSSQSVVSSSSSVLSSSPSVVSPSSFFENLQKSWKSVIEDASTCKDATSTSEEYSIKHEDLLSKVATLEDEPEETPASGDEEDPDDPGYPDQQNEEPQQMDVTTEVEEETDPLTESTKKEVEIEANVEKSKYFKANPHTFSLPTNKEKTMSVEEFDIEDAKMPKGWKIKEVTRILKSGRKETKRFFLTRDQHILKTGLAVLEFMRLTGCFTAKQIMDIARHLSVPVSRLEKYMELYL